MIRQVLLVTALAVGMTSYAAAQDAPDPADAPTSPAADVGAPPAAPEDGPAMRPGDMPPAPGMGAESDRPMHHGPGREMGRPMRHGMGPGPDRRGPPPPPPALKKGIELRMGRDFGLRIECGDEPIKVCLEAAKPLTDKIPQLTMPPAPPAPPANN